jgi:hypothetical protein
MDELAANELVMFVTTPLIGDADLYISTTKFPNDTDCDHCILKSATNNAELLSIAKSDTKWPTESKTFYVGVFAYTQTEFSFNVWTDRNNLSLPNDNVPLMGAGVNREFIYFEYKLPTNESFTLTVTPVTGFVRMYVTTNSNVAPNSYRNSMWSGNDYYTNIVNITTTDPNYGGEGTIYYIGVENYGMSKLFSLFATRNNNYIRLLEGLPIGGSVDMRDFRYFTFEVSSDYAGHRLTFILTQTIENSDPDLYITRDISSGPPGPNNYEWMSDEEGNDIKEIANIQAGRYYIGVTPWRKKAQFLITAVTEYQSLSLATNTVVHGHVGAGQYSFYRWYLGNWREAFHILASSTASIDLYESKTYRNPDENKYDTKGTPIGTSRILNHIASLEYQSHWYYFSVKGNIDSDFTIYAAYNYSMTQLFSNQYSWDTIVVGREYKYYYMDISGVNITNDISLTVTCNTGDADVYVSTTTQYPTMQNYQWKADEFLSDTLVISANDTKIGSNKRLYVGIYGFSGPEVQFGIYPCVSEPIIALGYNLTAQSAVDHSTYVFFYYVVQNTSYDGPVTFTVTMVDANKRVNVFADGPINKRPTSYNFKWKSNDNGSPVVEIPSSSERVYYIGVYGYSDDTNAFLISVQHDKSPVTSATPTTVNPTQDPTTTTQEPTTREPVTTTTVAPTIAPVVPTPSGIVVVTLSTTLIHQVTGDSSKLPTPLPASVLLYLSSDVQSSVLVTPEKLDLSSVIIYQATMNFSISTRDNCTIGLMVVNGNGDTVGLEDFTVPTGSVDITKLLQKRSLQQIAFGDKNYSFKMVAVTRDTPVSVMKASMSVSYLPTETPQLNWLYSIIGVVAVVAVVAIVVVIVVIVVLVKRSQKSTVEPNADLELISEASDEGLLETTE